MPSYENWGVIFLFVVENLGLYISGKKPAGLEKAKNKKKIWTFFYLLHITGSIEWGSPNLPKHSNPLRKPSKGAR